MACPDLRSLKKAYQFLLRIITQEKLSAMFHQHSKTIIEKFLKRRTGILSDNLRVRGIAKNILILLSWAGFMDQLLPEMAPIF